MKKLLATVFLGLLLSIFGLYASFLLVQTSLFWVFASGLFVLASLFVILPLWRGRNKQNRDKELRKNLNVSLFYERQEALKAELGASNIGQEQFDQLTAELQYTLLTDISAIDEPSQTLREGKKRNDPKNDKEIGSPIALTSASFIIPFIFVLLGPLITYVLYDHWGYLSDVEMMDVFQRTVDNRDDPEEVQSLIVSLGASVQENENQPWTWYFLAENFANIGMFSEAQIAYSRSAELLEDTPEKALVLGRVAMSMYINAGLQFTSEVLGIIDQARAINPNEISILQLLASDASENEKYEEAIQYWRLLIQANPNSEQAQQLRLNISAAQQILTERSPDRAGPIIEVAIALAEGLVLNENLRVFIAARNADREGMPPLAATSLVVGNLPMTVQLDNGSAVGPFNLSSAENIFVSALVSYAGTATPQVGDYRVVSEIFNHKDEPNEVKLIIAERVQ